jgi:hypothetical protein
MATGTATTPVNSSTGGASGSISRPGDRERFIEAQLRRTRMQVRGVELSTRLMLLASIAIAFFLTVALIDHWIVPGGLGIYGRLALLAVFLIGAAMFVARELVPLLIYRINPLYAAETIERSKPTLKNTLLNFLMLRSNKSAVPEVVLEAVREQAATNLSRTQIEHVVDRSRLIHVGYVLVGMVALFAAYYLLSPKSPLETAGRVILPWADIAAPSRVEISNVQPGTATVFQGEQAKVTADVRGLNDDETVTLIYSTRDRQVVDQAIRMHRPQGSLLHTALLPPPDRAGVAGSLSEGLEQDVEYRIEAGDARTGTYRLTVIQAPNITIDRIEYRYPPYTKLEKRAVQKQGNLKGIEGTQVTIHAQANQPIKSAYIDLGSDGRNLRTMKVDGQRAMATLTLALNQERMRPQFDSYRLKFTAESGHRNPEPVRYRIGVIPDEAPTVQFLRPEKVETTVPLNSAVEFELKALDPDYALAEIRLLANVNSAPAFRRSLIPGGQQNPLTGNVNRRHGEDLSRVKLESGKSLKAGDVVEYWAEAEDNKSPQPNVTKTEIRRLVIAPPQQNQQQNRDQQNQRDNKGGADDQKRDQQNDPNDQNNDRDRNQKQQDGGKGKQGEQGAPNQDQNNQGGNKDQQQKQDKNNKGAQGEKGGADRNRDQQKDNRQDKQPSEAGSKNNDDQQQNDSKGGQQNKGQQQGGNNNNQGDESGDQKQNSNGSGSDQSNSGGNAANKQDDGKQGNQASQKQHDPNAGGQNDTKDASQPRDRKNHQQPPPVAKDGDDGEAINRVLDHARGKQGDNQQQQPSDQQNTAQKQQSGQQKGNQQPADNDKQPGESGKQQKNNGETNQGKEQQKSDAAGNQKSDAEQGEKKQGAGKDGDGEKQSQSKPGEGQDAQGKRDEEKQGKPGDATPAPQERAKPQDQKGANEANGKSDEQKSPAHGKKQSDTKSDSAGDKSARGEKGGGQNDNKAGQGAGGKSDPSKDGSSAAKEQGDGDTGKEAGDQKKADGKTGRSGEEKGAGSKYKSGNRDPNADPFNSEDKSDLNKSKPATAEEKGQKNGQDQKGQSSKQSSDKSTEKNGSKTDSSESGKGQEKSDDNSQTDNKQAQQDGSGAGTGGGADRTGNAEPPDFPRREPGDDKANLEYAKKATDLALDHLRNQLKKGEPDKELLDKLGGWSKEDLERLVSRWEKMQRDAQQSGAQGAKARKEYEEAVRSLGIRPGERPGSTVRVGNRQSNDDLRGINESIRLAPPPEYADQFRAFRKGTSRAE